ncbi:hypothetical protein [Rothia sp. P4278]|uniref:hypothetical protein n=1 Tax=Rothia sp. P4278 TaxID=3402658 RepID=UPI003ADC1B72
MDEEEVGVEQLAARVQQVMVLSEAEAMTWRSRLREMVRDQYIKPADWAPLDKKEWSIHVKLVDDAGQTVAFFRTAGAEEITSEVRELTQEPVSKDVLVQSPAEREAPLDFSPIPADFLAHRQESFEARVERLRGKSMSDQEFEDKMAVEYELDDEFRKYMDNPRFARLVEQEKLIMDSHAEWTVGEQANFLSEIAGESMDHSELIHYLGRTDWSWDGVPGKRPEIPGSAGPIPFDVGKDKLLNDMDRGYWLKVSSGESERGLATAQLLTKNQAREIAEQKLGWKWVDHPDTAVIPKQSLLISEADFAVPDHPDSGGMVVSVDGWGFGYPEGMFDTPEEPEESLTVPSGTAEAAFVVDQYHQHFQEPESQTYGLDWD